MRRNLMAKYINTNIGLMPLEDYLETKAVQYGFESYEDMRAQGYKIDVEQIVEVEEDEKGHITTKVDIPVYDGDER
jgi:hypothetical protein